MNDQISHEGVQVCMKLSKLTAKTFWRGIKFMLATLNKNRKEMWNEIKTSFTDPRGKQTVKQLVGKGEGVSSFEMEQVKGFDAVARKYGVDYAVRKDEQGKYLVFFKAKDADALTAAFREYTSKKLERGDKPSLREQIRKHREERMNADHRDNPIKNKAKEALDR